MFNNKFFLVIFHKKVIVSCHNNQSVGNLKRKNSHMRFIHESKDINIVAFMSTYTSYTVRLILFIVFFP